VPAKDRVVFFGDSITDIWKLETYFAGRAYVNRGIGGQTTPQMLVRFRQDVIDLSPNSVVILAGTNDIAGNTGPMRNEDIVADLATMAELAKSHRIAAVVASILPVHNYTPRSQDFFAQRPVQRILDVNRSLKDYCTKNRIVYLDYFSAMVDEKGLLREIWRRTDCIERRGLQDHGAIGGSRDCQGHAPGDSERVGGPEYAPKFRTSVAALRSW
jgi:lysophospholipase L1-like esterase